MTDFHTDFPFSRRDLLKGGGALIVGFSMAGALPGTAVAARGDVAGPPDAQAVDSWIAIHKDNTATIYFGKIEMGQGNTTGMLQIAGEELDLDMSQMTAVRGDTHVTPDQGATSSSSSIHRGGPFLRAAAAEARQALLALAATRLGVQAGSLVVSKGVVSIDGQPDRSVKYGDLLGDKPFNVKFTGTAPVKPPSQYKLVGARVPRVDLPEKMAGKYTHMQHIRLPNMLHGRIVLPHGQRAFGAGATPVAIDESSIKSIPGARVVRKGDFVGVVAEQEWDAVKAAQLLKITWAETPALPANDMFERMRAEKTTDTVVADVGDPAKGFAQAKYLASASYRCPYQGHMPFAPNCAVADVTAERAHVMSSTQDVYSARNFLASVLGMKAEQIRVQYYEGSGTFGRSCYGDAEQSAAIMSQAVGRPVRVQFMRWDEHGWDQYGPAHLAEVRAGVDADGRIIAYEYHGWQHGWTVTSTVFDISLQKPGIERAGGTNSITVNPMSTGSMYKVANRRVVSHAVPMHGYLRGAALRSPLDLPLRSLLSRRSRNWRTRSEWTRSSSCRKNIGDRRWLGVLNAAAEAAKWTPKVMASSLSDAEIVTGRGIGLGTHHVSYGAAVAEVEVNKRTGNIVVKRVYAAMDVGLAVNPALVENQIVGQVTQAVSRVLKEEVTFDKTGVTSLDWMSYPVLRFAEHPDVVPVVVQRINEQATGAGEEVMGATAAAIANAFFDATGARLQQYPMTVERVRAALAEGSGKGAQRG